MGVALALVVAAVVAIALFDRAIFDPYGSHGRFDRAFGLVAAGMPRTEVVQRLGSPGGQGKEFHLSQLEGFEEHYRRAGTSGSRYYMFWSRGDVTYAVGFDAHHQVVMTASGGS